jgi:hypothetical protein
MDSRFRGNDEERRNTKAPKWGFFNYCGAGGFGSNPRFDKFAGSEFARPTKFAGSKFEHAKRGPKGELPDVIRNGARRARRREAPSNPDRIDDMDSRFRGNDEVRRNKKAPLWGFFTDGTARSR